MNLDELERLAREATPGPWRVVAGNKHRQFHMLSIQAPRGAIHIDLSNTSPVARVPAYGGDIGGSNAAYIAAANPAAILALCAVVRAAKAVVAASDRLENTPIGEFTGEELPACDAASAALRQALALEPK